ncbi:hypothetical protein GTA08_BOTSDO12991 [Neofusicoccum parvum]|uniref:Uncharacterized protein n=1 Tax=Neofusicoccum parvum TaxID=310453 RepID=A0ACB5SGV9_9PEZI|nr:hypothetical protein GTA08_BOTSDO12991 [Neofusicoccum parvum]
MALSQANVLSPQSLVHVRDSYFSRGGEKASSFVNNSSSETTLKVLHILGKYSTGESSNDAAATVSAFFHLVMRHVEARRPIPMVLPAFPYKSLNRLDKVLGVEPDLGEELALARLENLCRDIRKIYTPGASVAIVNDGLGYNDITWIQDEDVWIYESLLRDMAVREGFSSLRFHSMISVLDLCDESQITRDVFLQLCEPTRQCLVSKYGDLDFDVEKLLETNQDYLMTYRGYVKFFEKELEHRPEIKKEPVKRRQRAIVKGIAKKLIERGFTFAKVIRERFPEHVRLSIHPSSGKEKIYIPLIPQESFSMTPWHATVAVDVRGNFKIAHVAEFRASHDLVMKDGKPAFFRERSPLFKWSIEVEFTHRYGRSLLITRRNPGKSLMSVSDQAKLMTLAMTHKVVELKGFDSDA